MTPPCCPQNIDFAAFSLFLRQFTLNEHMSAAAGEAKTPALTLLVQSSEKLNVNPTNVFPFRCNKIQRIDTNNCMFKGSYLWKKKSFWDILGIHVSFRGCNMLWNHDVSTRIPSDKKYKHRDFQKGSEEKLNGSVRIPAWSPWGVLPCQTPWARVSGFQRSSMMSYGWRWCKILSFMISVVHLLHDTELNQSSKVFVSTTCFNLVVSVFFVCVSLVFLK